MTRQTKRTLLRLAAFQVGWFLCVLGAAHGLSWVGPLWVLYWSLLHLLMAAAPRVSAALILKCAILGTALDSVLAAAGLLRFEGWSLASFLSPLWMMALWINMATVMDLLTAMHRDRLFLGTISGAVAGPLAYFGGAELGALEFAEPRAAGLGALAVVWGLALPGLMIATRRALHSAGLVDLCTPVNGETERTATES